MSMRNKQKRYPPFVMIERATLMSEQWKQLTHAEMITYIYIKKNFKGWNNGQIPLKYSKLKGVFAPATLSKALKGLITKEWIEKTRHGGLFRFYCLYKLTGKHDTVRSL